jgi:hypothetical protein
MERARVDGCEAEKLVKRCFAGTRIRLDAMVGDVRGVLAVWW